MFDNSTLSQLKQLKKDIEDSKEYAEGIVKGTQRKFGFVVLADGREIFLNPDEMTKVFPGDNVKIVVELQKPIAMDDGVRFAIREGGRTVGSGVVTKIVE